MKRKHHLSIIIFSILGVFALIAAACGSSGGDDSQAAEAAGTAAGSSNQPSPRDTSRGFTYDEIIEDYLGDFDRDHPFQSLDEFCTTYPATSETLRATDSGITESEISIVHIRSQLEDFAAFGFFTNVGDPTEMFETYVNIVNDRCGGIYGRRLSLHTIEVPVLVGVDEARNAACLEAAEDRNAVFVMNTTGFQGSAGLCLAEKTSFISTQGQTDEFVETGNGRLISLSPSLEESLEYLADYLIATGALEGKTIGIVTPDTPGQREAVQSGLSDKLEALGLNVAVFDTLGCAGGTSCTEGLSDSVARMKSEGVDVLFPTLNVLSLPPYIKEMTVQGFEPGDIQFYNSDFNSQAGDLVTSKIVASGGEEAGALYNGTIIVDEARTGAFREPGYEEPAFNEMCAREYRDNSESGTSFNPRDADENSPYGMVGTVCTEMRIILRALYDAGPNPTRADVYASMLNLGVIDSNNAIPFSITPTKWNTPDVIHTTMFTWPCAVPGTGVTDRGTLLDTCVVPVENDEWRWLTE